MWRAWKPVVRIVLTGGPCGGKSTALARVAERMEAEGMCVFLVPEIATILAGAGASFAPEHIVATEAAILRLQLVLEDEMTRLAAAADGPSLVLIDRGTMDISAYVSPDEWQGLLDEHGWSEVELRDGRYDAVLHLVTAARGAEAHYTQANNEARREGPAEARELDRTLHDAWIGHPALRIIDNTTDFEGKVRRVIGAVARAVGHPEPAETERRFVVSRVADPLPVAAVEVEIEQVYLRIDDTVEERVRRRGRDGAWAYTHTVRERRHGERVRRDRRIDAREYDTLAGGDRPVLKKRRTCFLHDDRYFNLDTYDSGLVLLEVDGDDPPMPPFVEVEREVTGDPNFDIPAL